MSEYYARFLEALAHGSVRRRTDLKTGSEAIYRDDILICKDSDDPLSEPDLSEDIRVQPHLVLFGAGHIGKALYDLAVLQDMKVTVLDPREDQNNVQRFPKATRLVGEYDELLDKDYPDIVAPYYCIFTHGHRFDSQCLLYALRHPSSYIGMIGSKAKIEHCFERVREQGISEEQLLSVHSPIGLPINAVTPQEIAISIMAQLISVFRKNKSIITIDASVLAKAATKPGIMARIVQSSGSAPRSTGSMMFVTEDEIVGTVGGGSIESHTILLARQMLGTGEALRIEHHTLTADQPLGMVCGGDSTILLKRV